MRQRKSPTPTLPHRAGSPTPTLPHREGELSLLKVLVLSAAPSLWGRAGVGLVFFTF